MRLALGEWLPDVAPVLLASKGLTVAENMRAKAGGYFPFKRLVERNAAPLPKFPRGTLSGTDDSGNGYLFAGTGAESDSLGELFEYVADAPVLRSRAAISYAVGTDHRWDFQRFGDFMFAATDNEKLQFLAIGSAGTFDDVPGAPNARHVSLVGNHLVVGKLFDPQRGVLNDGISWSAVSNPLLWPVPGTDEAVAVNADIQPLEGDDGWIQDIVAGAEVGTVFQERAIWRMDPVGGRVTFDLKRTVQGIGMLVPHSGVAFERQIFFIAEDGFRLFNYTESTNIGKERVNQFFLGDLDQAFLDRVWVKKDSDATVIWIAYPGAGNVGGKPNKVIWYDYMLDRFSQGTEDLEALIENATSNAASLDAPATPGDPDSLGDDPPGDPENVGDTSFDDRGTATGESQIGAFNTALNVATFTGNPRPAVAVTGELEINPGMRSCLTSVRPLVSNANASVASVAKARQQEQMPRFGNAVAQDDDGKCNQRTDGRIHQLRIELDGSWDNALAVDLEAHRTGQR